MSCVSRSSVVGVGLVLAMLLGGMPGCYDLRPFAPSELAHLNGYDIHNETIVHRGSIRQTSSGPIVAPTTGLVTDRPYRVLDYRNEPMDFSSRTRLYLDITDVGRSGGRFNRIEVSEEMLHGQVLDEKTHVIEQINVPLSQIRRSELRVQSIGKTTALLLGIALGTSAVITALTLGLVAATARR